MKLLIFDTETSGFINNNLHVNHKNQAHLLQLAYIVYDTTLRCIITKFMSYTRYYHDFNIAPGAAATHGISYEMCKSGMHVADALELFTDQVRKCDLLIAHNYVFDSRILNLVVSQCAEEDEDNKLPEHKHYCTMEHMTDICALPHKSRKQNSKYKWPKLEEAYSYIRTGDCYKEKLSGSHDALVDVNACLQIYLWLLNRVSYKTEVSPNLVPADLINKHIGT